MNFFFFFFFFFIFFIFFRWKLLCLLSMEILFLYIIYCLGVESGSFSSFFILYFLGVFMVLDSVLGISLLVASSRNTSELSSKFTLF